MLKKFPDLRTDEEAEDWLNNADLSEYDLSGMKKVRFELARKDKAISLRLPASLLAQVKAFAARAKIPAQRLIRLAVEDFLNRAHARPARNTVRKMARAPRKTPRAPRNAA